MLFSVVSIRRKTPHQSTRTPPASQRSAWEASFRHPLFLLLRAAEQFRRTRTRKQPRNSAAASQTSRKAASSRETRPSVPGFATSTSGCSYISFAFFSVTKRYVSPLRIGRSFFCKPSGNQIKCCLHLVLFKYLNQICIFFHAVIITKCHCFFFPSGKRINLLFISKLSSSYRRLAAKKTS